MGMILPNCHSFALYVCFYSSVTIKHLYKLSEVIDIYRSIAEITRRTVIRIIKTINESMRVSNNRINQVLIFFTIPSTGLFLFCHKSNFHLVQKS